MGGGNAIYPDNPGKSTFFFLVPRADSLDVGGGLPGTISRKPCTLKQNEWMDPAHGGIIVRPEVVKIIPYFIKFG